jgi:shikimate kinase
MKADDARNVYLIGPRASGKSTLGRILAERLGRPFLDLDDVFRAKRGESIAALVEREGWDRFREIEAEILAEAAAGKSRVVATGGGVILLEGNRRLMSKGLVIYLQADPERLAERLLADAKPEQRPQLTEMGFTEEIKATLLEREHLYLQCAQVVLPERPVEELANKAMTAIAVL